MRALLMPVAGLVLLELLALLIQNPLVDLLAALCSLLLVVLLTVTTHRLILLGPVAAGRWGITRWTARETSLAVHMLILAMLLWLPIVVQFLPGIPFLGLVTLALSFWLLARFSLVLPAISVDRNYTFKDSWSATRTCQLQMLGVVFLMPLLFGIPVGLISRIPFTFPISSMLANIAGVVLVAALSIAYHETESRQAVAG